MSEAIAYWRAEHASFAHLLDLFEKKLAAFHTDETPDYNLMLDIVRYLRHFPDRYHHPREDIAFELMVAHDPALETQVARLLQEHRAIAVAGEELRSLLNQAVGGGALVPREKVEAAAATYLVYYRHHLASEEINIIPRAMELLTPADWAEVRRAVPPGIDPLFGADADAGYRELRRQIALESV